MRKPSLWSLLQKVHKCEEGSVSLETVLIVGAIALPIIIFVVVHAWPRMKNVFNRGMTDLENGTVTAQQQ